MAREAVFVVGLVVLGALFALAVQVARLRARGRRLALDVTELSRTVTTVQGWAAAELRALRDEFTVARVDASAAAVLAQLEKPSAASPAPPPKPDNDHKKRRERAAHSSPPAPVSAPSSEVHKGERKAPVGAPEEDDEETRAWTKGDAAKVRAAVAAGGAPRPPQATPRAALSVAVAPPASAAVPPPSSAPSLAAGLGRPLSSDRAPHAPPGQRRTATLAGMPAPLPLPPAQDDAQKRTSWAGSKQDGGIALSTRPPAASGPPVAALHLAPTLLSMAAQGAPPASPLDDRPTLEMPDPLEFARKHEANGKETTFLDLEPPRFAPRLAMRPSAPREPLAHPDLIGTEDRADEAAGRRLGPDDKTPRRPPLAVVPERGT